VICGAPPDQCDAHHLVHWIDGGETAVGNLVLLCKPNHREADRGEWIIQIVNGKVLVTRPGWAEPGHEPGQTGSGHAGSGDPERSPGGARARPDDPCGEPDGSGDPAHGESLAGESPASESRADESPAGESPAGRSRTGGWPQRGHGSGERAWPWSGDPEPPTKEAADQLDPWGDDQPGVAPGPSEKVTATAEPWPWGDSEEASPGP
jgi:hypothetical protein